MSIIRLTRRLFLAAAGALAATSLLGCGGGGGGPVPDDGTTVDKTTMWRLAGGGRRISNAAKKHNANKRFATLEAALAGRAHPGDTSFPVPIDTRIDVWEHAFADGRTEIDVRSFRLL